MRGEYFHTSHPGMCAAGSSPRAWGIHLPLTQIVPQPRFIPTCVGNTSCHGSIVTVISVHPHVRGEYRCWENFRFNAVGSSPRAWGIRSRIPAPILRPRFIPTCVGNTFHCSGFRQRYPVHPHVRGEYPRAHPASPPSLGSSSRAWGIPRHLIPERLHDRFIPTCVGNTFHYLCAAGQGAVHPHVRGEYCMARFSISWVSGSSPRAWGIPVVAVTGQGRGRFIPTCVGNTRRSESRGSLSPVHPHVRGEYLRKPGTRGSKHGSSPRAWGIRSLRCRANSPWRFIPTCVGNTSRSLPPCQARPVHPHVRGEYANASPPLSLRSGSSPRAWGIRSGERNGMSPNRFIPTCVGNTDKPSPNAN